MATLSTGASILAERASKKNDVSFIKEMKDLIVITAARIIANRLEKKPSIARYYTQRFIIDLEPVDITDECSNEVPECCDGKVYRTKEKLPLPIIFSTNPFLYIGAPDGSYGFGWTTFGTERHKQEKKLTGKNPRYTWINERVYIFNKDLPNIAVEGVFSDPRQLAKFRCGVVDYKPCYSDEQDYPIDEQTMKIVIEEILSKELRLAPNNEKIQIKEDKNV